MRQVFTSTRLQNVEQLAEIMREHGIDTKITDGRSFKGNSRREFSYSSKEEKRDAQPALWVIKPDDYKRARELLHEAGLLDNSEKQSYLPENLQFKEPAATNNPQARALKIKLVLLGIISVMAGLMVIRWVAS
jgi:hypothetical protein